MKQRNGSKEQNEAATPAAAHPKRRRIAGKTSVFTASFLLLFVTLSLVTLTNTYGSGPVINSTLAQFTTAPSTTSKKLADDTPSYISNDNESKPELSLHAGEPVNVAQTMDNYTFVSSLKYNPAKQTYFVIGDNGNSPTKYADATSEQVSQDIDMPTRMKLIRLQDKFQSAAEDFKTRVRGTNIYLSHIGLPFSKNEKIAIVDYQLGRTELTLPDSVHVEVSRIAYSKGKVLLGVANSFTGNAKSPGDLFIETDADTALSKLSGATKSSTVFHDVQYFFDKANNIIAGANYTNSTVTTVSERVDILDVIGLKGDDATLAARGYGLGGAIINNVPVMNVRAGGVCYWATAWSTAMRLGLDTYEIPYKVLSQHKHSDLNARYSPGSTNLNVKKDKNYFDVTVAYSTVSGGIGTIEQIESGKSLRVKTTVLLANAKTGRFIAITETFPGSDSASANASTNIQ